MVDRGSVAERLRQLPDTPPPRVVWERIEAQARAERLFVPRPLAAWLKWPAAIGLAASVALSAFIVPGPGGGDGPERFPTEPAYVEQASPLRLNTLNALMVESQQLEADLRSLPEGPQVVRAGTAATIAAVEDQVAAIDYRLNETPLAMPPEQAELYWRERVRLMNLLVQLRRAQAQRNAF